MSRTFRGPTDSWDTKGSKDNYSRLDVKRREAKWWQRECCEVQFKGSHQKLRTVGTCSINF